MQKEQRLYWSVSKPLRWLGLTIDEWVVLLGGIIPGLFMVNNHENIAGLIAILGGFLGMYFLKKFKKSLQNA